MARITPLHLVPAFLAAAAHAGEITIEPQLFFISSHFDATVVPTEPLLIQPRGKIWTDFKISELAPHGQRVNAGDLLARFHPAAIDHEISKIRHARDTATFKVSQAELALKHLSENAPIRLAALRLAARQAKEDLDYYNTTGRKAAEDRANQALKTANQLLSQQREELTRLTTFKQPDAAAGKPDDILVLRQRDSVATAEFALRMETLDQDHTLKVLIPREAESRAERQTETENALKQAEEDLHQQLGLKKFELDYSKAAAEQLAQDLAGLEADRQLFEVKAPAAGWLFHGELNGGSNSASSAIATFVPAVSKYILVAQVAETVVHMLSKDLEGSGNFSTQPDSLPLKITRIAETPSANGLYRVEISTTFPQGAQPLPGSALQAKFVSHQKPAAISVPSKALVFGPGGWTVAVKLADGKTEPRPVKTGLVSETNTEILSGLEPGQVIVIP